MGVTEGKYSTKGKGRVAGISSWNFKNGEWIGRLSKKKTTHKTTKEENGGCGVIVKRERKHRH